LNKAKDQHISRRASVKKWSIVLPTVRHTTCTTWYYDIDI